MASSITTPALDLTDPPASAGPRKLVRPRMPGQSEGKHAQARRPPAPPPFARRELASIANPPPGSQAELFYLQKQMQAQTPMVFVLDDGERIEGIIEWYDLHVIKVRHTTRTMIYKSSIKYLYKASE